MIRTSACTRGIRACVLLAALAPVAVAQEPIPDHRLFTGNDLVLAGAFAAATVAMFPLDRRIIGSVRDSARLQDAGLERGARIAGFLGSPGSLIAAGAFYGVGELTDTPRLTRLGLHAAQALVAGGVVTGALKTFLGRARPRVSADTNPADFQLLRGFRSDDFMAFPSGHVTVAFATAAAITADVHGWSAGTAWIVGPALYGGAALVGLSRMYEDKHWASDAVMGAAIGTFAGMKAVRFTRTHTGRKLERRLLGDDAQLRLGYSVRW